MRCLNISEPQGKFSEGDKEVEGLFLYWAVKFVFVFSPIQQGKIPNISKTK